MVVEQELRVVSEQLLMQALNAFLIGLGMGGCPGASTLGVAMFPVIAPEGYVKQFLAVVPVICLCSSSSTLIFNYKGAMWSKVKQMAAFLILGIGLGVVSLPFFSDRGLKKTIAATYATLLAQRLYEQYQKYKANQAKKNDDLTASKSQRKGTAKSSPPTKGTASSNKTGSVRASSPPPLEFTKDEKSEVDPVKATEQLYDSNTVAWPAALFCGWITVVANSSGPIFNIYLLACGYNMDQFVATRAVFMATNNFCTVVSRALSGSLNQPLILHGVMIGVVCVFGVLAGKPLKKIMNPAWYEYLTYISLSSSIYGLLTSG